jgi:hypothetical protein
MNNTEKKLDALIDALGFDVEKVTTNRSEVEQFKIRKRDIIDRCLVGYTPIGSRPKPKYHYKLTKRDEPVEENKTITVPRALNMLSKRDRDIVDNVRMEMGSLGEPVVDEPQENLLAGIFARITPVDPSTALKHMLLTILKKAGKGPKKDTITLMNHEIDLAFKNE